MKKFILHAACVAVTASAFTLALFNISPKFVHADSSYSFTAHQADFESTDSTTNFQDMDDVPHQLLT